MPPAALAARLRVDLAQALPQAQRPVGDDRFGPRLAAALREHPRRAGCPSLGQLARGTVSKTVASRQLRPYDIEYALEKREPDFEGKMA